MTQTETSQPLLRFANVGKTFGTTVAVRNLDLEIPRGAFVAIMGPSGCGKTTMLRMLAGLEKPSAGRILHNGRSIDDVPPWERRMPLVWQNYALFPFLSVADNVGFGLRNDRIGKQERRRRSLAWLDRLGIADLADRSPDTLSGGQAQRVALARALVLEPDILLLDEPLSALDANMVVRMQTELAQLQRDLGITFVYVTHNQSEAFAMADTVVIMNAGEIQQVGSPMAVYRAPKTRFVAGFVGTNNIVDGIVESVDPSGCTVRTAHGSFVSTSPSNASLSVDQRVHLVVSADLIEIRRNESSERPNSVRARLVGESFSGNVALLVFESASGFELRVQVQQRALEVLELKRDEDITLSFESRDALLVPASPNFTGAQ
jgi:spermidine/putrescine transport system ATP-binding protein